MARLCGGGDSIFRAPLDPALPLPPLRTHFGLRPLPLMGPGCPTLATALLVGVRIVYLTRRRSLALITKRALALLLPKTCGKTFVVNWLTHILEMLDPLSLLTVS